MRYGDSGPEVKALQVALIARGYSLTRFGADGHLGDETWEALQRFAEDNRSIVWNPILPMEVLNRLGREPTEVDVIPSPVVRPSDETNGIPVVDLRSEQSSPSPKSKVVGGKTVIRNPSAVTGIVIHQTAIPFGIADYQIAAAGGDRDLALQRRALGVACHAMAFRKGFVVWSNPLKRYIYHGHGFNRFTLGLEIDGRYAGVKDDPSTVMREDWKSTWNGKPNEVTDLIVQTARAGVRLLVEEGRRIGMPIRNVYAHRQSSAERISDPGQELWERVVLEFAVPVLGLVPHQKLVLRDGYPVPKEWDPDGVGSY